MMQHIMRESDSMPQSKLAQPAYLELVNEIKNIIDCAQKLEQPNAVHGEFIALKQTASY